MLMQTHALISELLKNSAIMKLIASAEASSIIMIVKILSIRLASLWSINGAILMLVSFVFKYFPLSELI